MKRWLVKLLWSVTFFVLLSCSTRPHGLIYESELTLWLLDPEQGIKKPLVESVRYAVGVSHDLQHVAYSTDSHDLWIANIDRTHARQVIGDRLREAGLGISRVLWSPEDKRIAVLAVPIEDPQLNLEKATLYVVDLPTDEIHAVATGVTGFVWTHTGDHLVVIKQFSPNEIPGVYLISANNLASRLLFEGVVEPYIAISPMGDKVSFAADKSEHEFDLRLFIVDLTSGEVTDLLQNFMLPLRGIKDLAWSPDEKYLAFIAMLPGEGTKASFSLFLLDSQTFTWQELARDTCGPLAWSPRGHAIATSLCGTKGIYQVSVATGDVRKLTDDQLARPTNFIWR